MKRKPDCTLVIPDLHAPYQHPDCLKFLKSLKDTYRPTSVVQLGDLVDHHRMARWDAEPSSAGLMEEVLAAKEFLADLGDLFPTMTVTLGNHDVRLIKRAKKAGIPERFLRRFEEVFETPKGWEYGESYTENGVYFFHGDGFSGASAAINAAQAYRSSVVMGHVHAFAGVAWLAGPQDTLFAVNSGCLIDKLAIAFEYGKTCKHKPMLGATVILNGIPMFIPMQVK